jgi:hypothetical protein
MRGRRMASRTGLRRTNGGPDSGPLPQSSAANSIDPTRVPGKLETQDYSPSAQFASPNIPKLLLKCGIWGVVQPSGTSLFEHAPDDFNAQSLSQKQ